MKKIMFLMMAVVMLFSIAACGSKEAEPETIGQTLALGFKKTVEKNSDLTALEIAESCAGDSAIPFDLQAVNVEQGLLTGFVNAEITGFKDGAMFAPIIGTIPFVGYIFVLEDGADVDAFMETLKTESNPRWNICTEAEETVVENVGNTVFFVMCPAQAEDTME